MQQLSYRQQQLLEDSVVTLLSDMGYIDSTDISFEDTIYALQQFTIDQRQAALDVQFEAEVAQASIDLWGQRAQGSQATEECAELIVALNKYFNRDYNSVNAEAVITEVADVEIMMYCMRLVFGHHNVEQEKKRKIARLASERLGLEVPEGYLN